MDAQFGGILGLVGCSAVLIRQWIQGDSFEHTMWMAIGGLFTYGLIGFFIGKVAEFIVKESVRTTVQKEIDAQQKMASSQQSM